VRDAVVLGGQTRGELLGLGPQLLGGGAVLVRGGVDLSGLLFGARGALLRLGLLAASAGGLLLGQGLLLVGPGGAGPAPPPAARGPVAGLRPCAPPKCTNAVPRPTPNNS
jgi:hypothetical protein